MPTPNRKVIFISVRGSLKLKINLTFFEFLLTVLLTVLLDLGRNIEVSHISGHKKTPSYLRVVVAGIGLEPMTFGL